MKTTPKYKIIFFDADGTLFDYDQSENYALENALKHYDCEFNPEIRKKSDAIGQMLWVEYELGKRSIDSIPVEKFRLLSRTLSIDANPSDFNKRYIEYLSLSTHLCEYALEVCEELSKYCTLIITTNGMAKIQKSRLESSQIKQYIKHLITSGDAGCFKPSRGYFDYAVNVLGLKDEDKKDILLVGYSLNSDIAGGNNFGITTCWINPLGKDGKGIKIDYLIKDLRELYEIILVNRDII